MTIFSGTGSDGAIYFGDSSAADGQGQIKYAHGSNAMTFTTNDGAASLTLDSGLNATFAGNVGIGGITPTTIFEVRCASDEHFTVSDALSTVALKAHNNGASAYIPMSINASTLALNTDSGGSISFGGDILSTPIFTAGIRVRGGASTPIAGEARIGGHASHGAQFYGSGAGTDLIFLNKNGSTVMSVATGTINTTFAGDIIVPNGKISTIGGNNLTLSGSVADHAGISFATNSILPCVVSAITNNVVDLGQNGNAYKDLYLGGEIISGGGATFAGDLTVQSDGGEIFLKSADYTISRIIPRGTGADLDKGLFSLFNGSTETVRIDTAGNSWFNGNNVGIGTTSPTSKLEVSGNINVIAPNPYIWIGESGSGGGAGFIGWNDASNYLYLGHSYGSAFNKNLVIADTGSVGIGNTFPASFDDYADNLVVGTGSGHEGMTIYSGSSNYGSIYFADDSTGTARYKGWVSYLHNSEKMFFAVNEVNRMVIDVNGNVGIGTTAPTNTLSVVSGGNLTCRYTGGSTFSLYQNNTDGTVIFSANHGDTGSENRFIWQSGGAVERMRLVDGNLGLGTNAIPTNGWIATGGGWKMLQIGQSSQIAAYGTDDEIAICQNTYLNTSGVFQAITSNVAGSSIILVDGVISFKNATTSGTAQTTTTRMRINSTGNVGIGTTADNDINEAKLYVNGTLGLDANSEIKYGKNAGGPYLNIRSKDSSTSACGIRIHSPSGSPGYLYGEGSSGSNAYIGILDGDGAWGYQIRTDTSHTWLINNSNQMHLTTTGLGIGNTVPANKLHVTTSTGQSARFEATGQYTSLIEFKSLGTAALPSVGAAGDDYVVWTNGAERMRISSAGKASINHATSNRTLVIGGALDVQGTLYKTSGSFAIDHPLESKKDTHKLIHSFIEGPKADNIYRGKAQLKDGSLVVNLDTVSEMTEGTFVLLNRDVQCFTSNESDWDSVKGTIEGNLLTISCKNASSNAMISWMVVGERQDKEIKESELTDDNGKVIVEPTIEEFEK